MAKSPESGFDFEACMAELYKKLDAMQKDGTAIRKAVTENAEANRRLMEDFASRLDRECKARNEALSRVGFNPTYADP